MKISSLQLIFILIALLTACDGAGTTSYNDPVEDEATDNDLPILSSLDLSGAIALFTHSSDSDESDSIYKIDSSGNYEEVLILDENGTAQNDLDISSLSIQDINEDYFLLDVYYYIEDYESQSESFTVSKSDGQAYHITDDIDIRDISHDDQGNLYYSDFAHIYTMPTSSLTNIQEPGTMISPYLEMIYSYSVSKSGAVIYSYENSGSNAYSTRYMLLKPDSSLSNLPYALDMFWTDHNGLLCYFDNNSGSAILYSVSESTGLYNTNTASISTDISGYYQPVTLNNYSYLVNKRGDDIIKIGSSINSTISTTLTDLTEINTACGSKDYLFLYDYDAVDNSLLYRIDPTDDSYESLTFNNDYEIWSMKAADNNILFMFGTDAAGNYISGLYNTVSQQFQLLFSLASVYPTIDFLKL